MKALKQHELNFYTKFLIDPEKIKRRNKLILYAIPVVILVTGLAVAVADLVMQKNALNAEIDEMQSALGDMTLMERYDRAMTTSGMLSVYDEEIRGIELFMQIKGSYPIVGKSEIFRLRDSIPDEVVINDIKYEPEKGYIEFTATSGDVKMIPKYIDRLKGTGLLIDADYSGYAQKQPDGFEDFTEEDEGYYLTVKMQVNKPELDIDLGEFYSVGGMDGEEDAGSEEGIPIE